MYRKDLQAMKCCCGELPCITMAEHDDNAYAKTLISCELCEIESIPAWTMIDAILKWNEMINFVNYMAAD